MSFKPSACWECAGAGLLLAGLLAGNAQAVENAQASGGASPKKPAATNSVASAAPSKVDGLKRLEEELSKSLEPFSPKSSLDTVLPQRRYIPPAPRVIVPNKRAKEERDRRLNWAFLEPNETEPGTPLEDLLKLSGPNKDEPKKNAVEEFYDRLNRQRNNPRKQGLSPTEERDLPGSRQESNAREDTTARDEDLTGGMKDSTQRLRRALGLDTSSKPSDTARSRSVFSEVFGSSDSSLSTEEVKQHKEYMERFKEVLPGSSLGSIANPLGQWNPLAPPNPDATGKSSAQPSVTGGFDALATAPRHGSLASSPGSINSFLTKSTAPNLSGSVLNQWNPFYSPPKFESPRPAPLSSPALMEAPRRRF
jgi:hypothetical protein